MKTRSNNPAMRSAAEFLLDYFRTRPCDSEGVMGCARCNAVALARLTLERLAPTKISDNLMLADARDILSKSNIRVLGNEEFILRLMKAHLGRVEETAAPPVAAPRRRIRVQHYPWCSFGLRSTNGPVTECNCRG